MKYDVLLYSTGQPQADWSAAEQKMFEEFRDPIAGRKYRQGTSKCFFNYLLLDPSVADVIFNIYNTYGN